MFQPSIQQQKIQIISPIAFSQIHSTPKQQLSNKSLQSQTSLLSSSNSPILILQKLKKFIIFHNIQAEQLFSQSQSSSLQKSLSKLSQTLNQQYGYYLSNKQLSMLLKLQEKHNKQINKEIIMKELDINIWKKQEDNQNYQNNNSKNNDNKNKNNDNNDDNKQVNDNYKQNLNKNTSQKKRNIYENIQGIRVKQDIKQNIQQKQHSLYIKQSINQYNHHNSKTKYIPRPISYNTSSSKVLKKQLDLTTQQPTQPFIPSTLNITYASHHNPSFMNAKKYSESRIKLKIQSLKKNIQQNVLQKKWDFIVMAGEMNQWIEKLIRIEEKQNLSGSNFMSKCPNEDNNNEDNNNMINTYKNYKYKVLNTTPITLLQINLITNQQLSIPQPVFIKKYQTLKKRISLSLNCLIPLQKSNNKNNLKGTVLMVLQQNDKLTKNTLNNRLNQRDNELNLVLLQIMRMKSMFQWQSKILNQVGVNL